MEKNEKETYHSVLVKHSIKERLNELVGHEGCRSLGDVVKRLLDLDDAIKAGKYVKKG